jgi:hypothetical protein
VRQLRERGRPLIKISKLVQGLVVDPVSAQQKKERNKSKKFVRESITLWFHQDWGKCGWASVVLCICIDSGVG